MLQKIGEHWEFVSEEALETLVWTNLGILLGLEPLKRQFIVNREICDVLGVSASKQLYILELKNTEDRYLVQQLTRYFDHIITERPLADQVDYSQPVRLIAIAPDFHDHNWIDRKYCNLEINFYQFRLQSQQNFQGVVEFSLWEKKQQIANFLINLESKKSQDLDQSTVELNPNEVEGKKIKESLDYYIWYRNGHKLGLPPIQPPSLATAKKVPKGSKVFKVIVGYLASRSRKTVTVRVPGRINLYQFSWYITNLVPTALGYYSPDGQYHQTNGDPEKYGNFNLIKIDSEGSPQSKHIHARYPEDLENINKLIATGWQIVFKCSWVDGDKSSLVTKLEPGTAYEAYLDFWDLKLLKPHQS